MSKLGSIFTNALLVVVGGSLLIATYALDSSTVLPVEPTEKELKLLISNYEPAKSRDRIIITNLTANKDCMRSVLSKVGSNVVTKQSLALVKLACDYKPKGEKNVTNK